MNKWIKIDSIDELQPGDIIEVEATILLFPGVFKHYGIVITENGENKIIQNIGKETHIAPLEEVIKNKPIQRVMRTNLSNEVVAQRFNECKLKKYSFFKNNCEDIIREICQCDIGFDQRRFVALILLILIILILVYLATRK